MTSGDYVQLFGFGAPLVVGALGLAYKAGKWGGNIHSTLEAILESLRGETRQRTVLAKRVKVNMATIKDHGARLDEHGARLDDHAQQLGKLSHAD